MLAIIGDTHLGRSLFGYDLTPHIRRTIYKFFRFCKQREAIAAVALGDIFDRPRPNIELEKIAIQCAQEFERAQIRLFIMAGNHDVIAKRGVTSALDVLRAANLQFVNVIDRPFRWAAGSYWTTPLVFVPFPSPGLYESDRDWQEEISAAIPNRGDYVAFTHLNMPGAKLGDQEWVYRGGDHDIPTRLIEGATLVVNGHIHKPQRVGKVYMPGACQRLRFSEHDNRLSFGWMENSHKLRLSRQTGIELRQIEIDVSAWAGSATTADVITAVGDEDITGAIVKLQPFVDERSVCQWPEVEAHLYRRGAAHVQLSTPILTRKKQEQQTNADSAVGEPLEAAKGFIRSRIKDKEERREIYCRFKRVQGGE